jgi:hypothetical protein
VTGPEHYLFAARLMSGRDAHPDLTAEALVHATLALAAATAEAAHHHNTPREACDAWAEVLR